MYVIKLKKADNTISLRNVKQSITLQQTGRRGPQGEPGEPGEGVPTGGTIGEVLTKQSNVDFDTDWEPVPSAPVQSVNGQTGVVILDKSDIGLSNVDNTSDLDKPISNDTQAALDTKADESDLSNYVDLTTDQTIGGEKTFSGATTFSQDVDINGLVANNGGLALGEGSAISDSTLGGMDAPFGTVAGNNAVMRIITWHGTQQYVSKYGPADWYISDTDGTNETNVMSAYYNRVEIKNGGNLQIIGGNAIVSNTSGDSMTLDGINTNTILRFRNNGTERGAIYSLNGNTEFNLRSQGELRLISNNSGTAQTTSINNGTFDLGTQTLAVGPQSDDFQTGFMIRRNGLDTGRIDNNGNGMRLQSFGGDLYLRNNNSSFGRGLLITQTDLIQVETSMTLDINNQPVINVPTPTEDDHAVNKAYVDNAAALNDWQPEDYGFYSWAYDVSAAANSASMTSGTMFTIRLKVSEAQDITSAHFVCSGSGSGLTDGYVAVYQDGNLLVQSSDISADFTSTGSKNVTFPATTIQPGYIDLGIWFTGTGMPNLGRSSQLSGTAGFLTGNDARFATADTSLTDTAPATLGTKTSSNFNVWGAVGFLV